MGRRPATILVVSAVIVIVIARFFTAVGPDCPSVFYYLLAVTCPAAATSALFRSLQVLAGLLMFMATLGAMWRLLGLRRWGWIAIILLFPFLGIISWVLIGPDANER